jgi:hypothetical protein
MSYTSAMEHGLTRLSLYLKENRDEYYDRLHRSNVEGLREVTQLTSFEVDRGAA